MSTKYYALLTNVGAARLANATALGSRLEITQMAVGDGGGTLPTPNPAQTKLVNEQRRAAINTLSIDANNPSQIIAEQVIPESEGGFWIREIGLFDADGNLIAIANCAETYKPQLQEGSGRIQTVRMILIVSSTESVSLKIDPAVVLATRGYVDNALVEHEKSRKHPDATLTAKGLVQLSSVTDSDSETLAATPKAVKAANDNASGRVPAGRKVNNKALSADITLSASDVGAYSKTETDTKVATATEAANNANDNANGRVPSVRKVNNKALSADITLSASDVGAYSKTETDTKVATATDAASSANDNANGRVPSGRKVNGKALTADISLSASDVGAYTKAETDTKVSAAATAATNANDNANGRVPAARKVNGKALSADITLTAADVGALATSGTAAAAAKLATARTINGVAFDGATNISLPLDLVVGAPVPYPLATAPSGWLKCNGQTFNKTTYPQLALAYPSGVLPDLRGEFIRGFDDGRGVDTGRSLLSAQGDAMRNITGQFETLDHSDYVTTGVFNQKTRSGAGISGSFVGMYHSYLELNISAQVPTAAENRPRNIAFNYIVRAA